MSVGCFDSIYKSMMIKMLGIPSKGGKGVWSTFQFFSALIWDIREGVEVKNIFLNLWTFAIMILICSDMLMECLLWIFLC